MPTPGDCAASRWAGDLRFRRPTSTQRSTRQGLFLKLDAGSARRSGGDWDDHLVLTGSAADACGARRSSRPRYWMPFGPHMGAHALIILICPGDNLKAGCVEDVGCICSVAALPGSGQVLPPPVRLRHDIAMLICK
ncbi:hypothetical protein VTN00DRAFT_1238 [Thermoascus crustaceus]|uniref:uncharacterized protein n=1 Tax=Thermoascus crustaceus TaxID=5088 RepID=UPI00374230CB